MLFHRNGFVRPELSSSLSWVGLPGGAGVLLEKLQSLVASIAVRFSASPLRLQSETHGPILGLDEIRPSEGHCINQALGFLHVRRSGHACADFAARCHPRAARATRLPGRLVFYKQ